MLDRDLAELFNVKATRLREQLKRNVERFPPHFIFQLTNEEVEIMVSISSYHQMLDFLYLTIPGCVLGLMCCLLSISSIITWGKRNC